MKCHSDHSSQALMQGAGFISCQHAFRSWACGFLVALALCGLGAVNSKAALLDDKSIALAWDPSTAPNVFGYKVHYGTASGNYTQVISAGAATNATISGLIPGTTYFFAATALDTAGMESTYSNEIEFTMPGTASGLAIGIGAAGMTLSGTGVPGQAYQLEGSADMKTWSPLATVTPNTSGSFQWVQPLEQGSKFFRIAGQ